MTNEQWGMILSVCGMLVTVISFQVKAKKKLLILQTIGTAFYLVSYIFSDGGIAVILNVIYLVRNFLFMYLDEGKEKKGKIACILLCVSYFIAYMVYTFVANKSIETSLWNLLPILGAVFGTIAAMQSNVNKLRLWKYGDSLSWLAFNIRIGIGALGGIVGEIVNLLSLTIGFLRFRTKERDNEKI